MKEKPASSILLFLLLTLVTCSNVKTMNNSKKTTSLCENEDCQRLNETIFQQTTLLKENIKTELEANQEIAELQKNCLFYSSKLDETSKKLNTSTQESDNKNTKITELTIKAEVLQESLMGCKIEKGHIKRNMEIKLQVLQENNDKLEKTNKKLQVKTDRADQNQNLANMSKRCMPFFCGATLATGANFLLSQLGETKKIRDNKYFKFLHSSVQDTKNLQTLSLIPAVYGGEPHSFLNGNSADTESLKNCSNGQFLQNSCKIGAKNVFMEIANAAFLRLCWHKFTPIPFVARRLKKIEESAVIRTVKRLPKPVKIIGQGLGNFARLLVIRNLCYFEKSYLDKF